MQNNIGIIRKKKKINQKALAKHLKITQQAVSYMENNDIEISLKKKIKISEFLGEDIEKVFPEMKLLKKAMN